jgi:hypothetical protein
MEQFGTCDADVLIHADLGGRRADRRSFEYPLHCLAEYELDLNPSPPGRLPRAAGSPTIAPFSPE